MKAKCAICALHDMCVKHAPAKATVYTDAVRADCPEYHPALQGHQHYTRGDGQPLTLYYRIEFDPDALRLLIAKAHDSNGRTSAGSGAIIVSASAEDPRNGSLGRP